LHGGAEQVAVILDRFAGVQSDAENYLVLRRLAVVLDDRLLHRHGARNRVAVLQFAATPGDVTGNVSRVVHAVREHGPSADLVVAPELITTGYDLELVRRRGHELAEPSDGPSVKQLTVAAMEADATVVVGFL
jgi:hypothetical protein